MTEVAPGGGLFSITGVCDAGMALGTRAQTVTGVPRLLIAVDLEDLEKGEAKVQVRGLPPGTQCQLG
ncbi:hypothetical protein D0Z06_18850 [Geodermatophilus marinus]|nr:hypothetical protein D0Z06_18850 [Geodermatophilus sp. LHW52908]